jgi:hypothetical protein
MVFHHRISTLLQGIQVQCKDLTESIPEHVFLLRRHWNEHYSIDFKYVSTLFSVPLTMRHLLSAEVGTTLPTSGGLSVGIVRSRTKETEFFFSGSGRRLPQETENSREKLSQEVQCHRTCWFRGEVLDLYSVRISGRTPAILSDTFRGFPQSL